MNTGVDMFLLRGWIVERYTVPADLRANNRWITLLGSRCA
jgi:hypothetical protein